MLSSEEKAHSGAQLQATHPSLLPPKCSLGVNKELSLQSPPFLPKFSNTLTCVDNRVLFTAQLTLSVAFKRETWEAYTQSGEG